VVSLLKGESPDDSSIHSLLFLMDGLNEMPFQSKTRPELNRFIQAYPHHRFIISCRCKITPPCMAFEPACYSG